MHLSPYKTHDPFPNVNLSSYLLYTTLQTHSALQYLKICVWIKNVIMICLDTRQSFQKNRMFHDFIRISVGPRTNSSQHYNDVIMSPTASQITSLTIVFLTVYSDADQSKHQISASLAFVRGIHRGPVNSPHKWPVTRKMFPFDDVIMSWLRLKTHMSVSAWFIDTGHRWIPSIKDRSRFEILFVVGQNKLLNKRVANDFRRVNAYVTSLQWYCNPFE